MAKGQVKIDKIAQDMTSAGKQQAEAYAACFGILFKGSEDIVKTNTAFIQKFAEKQAQYMNDSLQVKTLNEWAETQNEIAQANLNDLMDMATRTSEQCVKLAVDVMAPINQQIGETVKKAGKSMAA
ncbi:MAG: phasin family protein [Rhodospirillales bacterium]|nr:phasin family protein [Rhodospirillales bacterium]